MICLPPPLSHSLPKSMSTICLIFIMVLYPALINCVILSPLLTISDTSYFQFGNIKFIWWPKSLIIDWNRYTRDLFLMSSFISININNFAMVVFFFRLPILFSLFSLAFLAHLSLFVLPLYSMHWHSKNVSNQIQISGICYIANKCLIIILRIVSTIVRLGKNAFYCIHKWMP